MRLHQPASLFARSLATVAILSMILTTPACSWFRKKGKNAEVASTTANYDANTLKPGELTHPEDAPMETPRPVGLVDADQFLTRVYFDYDKSDIRADQLDVVEANLKYLKSNPDAKVLIEGHCDERGTTEYNFALGDRRAGTVMNYFVQGGIATDRLQTLSKGEEEPVDPGHDENAWSKNRRVQFKFINSGP